MLLISTLPYKSLLASRKAGQFLFKLFPGREIFKQKRIVPLILQEKKSS